MLQDAYITARFKPWAAVTVGKFKQQVGLERLVGDADTRFPERGFPTRPGAEPRPRCAGRRRCRWWPVHLQRRVHERRDGRQQHRRQPRPPDTESDAKGDVNARVFFQPFLNSDNFALRGLGFGIGGTYVDSTGNGTNTLLPSY